MLGKARLFDIIIWSMLKSRHNEKKDALEKLS